MKQTTFTGLLVSTLMLASVSAQAIEAPPQKPGRWETRMVRSPASKGHEAPLVAENCLDASALADAKQMAEDYAKKNCSKNETTRAGNRWTTEMVCKMGGSTMTTHSVTDVASDSAYHTEMTVTYTPPLAGQSRSTTTVDGKRLGDCTPK